MVEERLQFIEECKSQEWSMAEVCRRFQISRRTGYKWLQRYEADGIEGLKDRSHAPHHINHSSTRKGQTESGVRISKGGFDARMAADVIP